MDAAARIEATLNFSVGFEPPDRYTEQIFGLSDTDLVRVVALTLARVEYETPVEVNLLLTTDGRLRELNRDFRERDEITDVLSFPQANVPLVQAPADQLWQPENGETEVDEETAANAFEDADFFRVDGEPQSLGDIAISTDAVTRQAAVAGHSPAWELAYLLSHGVLHLLGYDDHTEAGYQAMVNHQNAVLDQANIER